MFNITLICTIHSKKGKCNPDELYKILESINPEVIFDELPKRSFEFFFNESFEMINVNKMLQNQKTIIEPIEVECLKRYMQNYKIKIIPVDLDISSQLAKYESEIISLFSKFYNHADYNELDNEKNLLIENNGFQYLNSIDFLELIEKMEILEKKIMEAEIDKSCLDHIYNIFKEEQFDNRENEMLQNIYNYSNKNQYNKAVFLIGARHKRSILQKIPEYEKLSKVKINWSTY